MLKKLSLVTVGATVMALGSIAQAEAATLFSTGSGSAVTDADITATFDGINANGIDLSGYQENGLEVSVNDGSFVGFNAFGTGVLSSGFHYGRAGNNSFVTIKTLDGSEMLGLEFLLGSGGPSDVFGAWETYRDGTFVSSGSFAQQEGDIVGWSDMSGFDELRVGADRDASYSLGDYQAIALDNVRVELAGQSVSTPEPASILGLLAVSAGSAFSLNRKQKNKCKP
jgi:hypothetical protein